MNAPAYRAVARVARRQAARARWRSVLVITTIALPIAALSATAICIRTAIPTPAERRTEQFGTADLDVYPNRSTRTSTELERLLPAGSVVSPVEMLNITHPVVANGSIIYFPVYEYGTSIEARPVRGLYRLLDGHLPTRPGEAVASPTILDGLGLHVGGVLTPRSGVDLTITGTVAQSGHLHEPVVVAATGTFESLRRGWSVDTFMVDLPAGVSASSVVAGLQREFSYTLPSDLRAEHTRDEEIGTAAAFAVAALLLLATGLIAGAALSIGARRQLRTLGLLGATGAERRHLRWTVLLTGGTLGAVGSGIGVVLGIAVALALHPFLDGIAGRYVGPIEVPILPLVGALALGTVASLLAAWLPARTATRGSVVDALAERSAPPRRPGRIAVGGIAVAILGGVAAVRGIGSTNDPLAAGGIVAMVVGILAGIPLLVSWTGRLASLLPAVPRIAARDVARHGRRTGAALAACAMAVAIPVGIAAQTLSDQARALSDAALSVDQLNISSVYHGAHSSDALGKSLDALRAAFPGSVDAQVTPAAVRRVIRGRERLLELSVIERVPDGYYTTPVAIGGPDLLRAFGASDAMDSLKAGHAVAIGGSTGGSNAAIGLDREAHVRILARVPLVAGPVVAGQQPREYVISPGTASRLGFVPDTSNALNAVFRAASPLSSDDIARAKRILSRYPGIAATSAADVTGGSRQLRTFVTAGGIAVMLVIIAVIVALMTAEARRDRAILVAVGASPRSRRAVAGASAATVGVLSAIVGGAIGLATSYVLLHSQARPESLLVPWAALGELLVGTPVLAGLLSASVSRQPSASQLLRPIS